MSLSNEDIEKFSKTNDIDGFYKAVKEDLKIETHPNADKLMHLAWEFGHAYGLHEVYIYAQDLVELLR